MVAVFVDALALHSKKRNDYVSDQFLADIPEDIRLLALFFDIRRKYSRLFNAIVGKKGLKVNEHITETATDLGVYAFMLAAKGRQY